jgi:hypothetical protein
VAGDSLTVSPGSIGTGYVIRAVSEDDDTISATGMLDVVRMEIAPAVTNVNGNASTNCMLGLANSYSGTPGAIWASSPAGMANVGWNNTNFWFNPSNSIATNYLVTAWVTGYTNCMSVATVNVIRASITDILDKNSNSVLGAMLDVKTNVSQACPATIRYRIDGVPSAVDAAESIVRIRYDSTNDAHQFLYGTNTLVRTLGDDTNEAALSIGGNEFEVQWNGRDDREGENRLLLAGTFGINVSFTLTNYGGMVCESSNVFQQIAPPHAGHFCGDWPRSSMYTNSTVPGGGSLTFYGNTNNVDENPTDHIYPTLKAAYGEADGFWSRLQMKFEWRNYGGLEGWVVYTPTNPTPGMAKGPGGGQIPQETNALFQIKDLCFRNDYPYSRQAYIARYNGSDYDVYRQTNFWSTNYLSMGEDIGGTGDTEEWVSYNTDSDNDVLLRLDPSGYSPAVNSEVAVVVFPCLLNSNGVWNIGGGYSNGLPENIVQVALSGFGGLSDGDGFALYAHSGYTVRKFWSYPIGSTMAGVDLDGAITGSNGYSTVSYVSPQSTNDYGNVPKEEATASWTNTLGLVEISTHGAVAGLGWYTRVYEAGDDTNSVDELYDPAHDKRITASDVASLDLDDVNLAILVGCHTADENDNGDSMVSLFAQVGADAVMGWTNLQNPNTILFAKLFLQRAFEKSGAAVNLGLPIAIDVSWTNYPKVWEARDAAYVDLAACPGVGTNNATYVYTNVVVNGASGANYALNIKVYPPRYGIKDKEN